MLRCIQGFQNYSHFTSTAFGKVCLNLQIKLKNPMIIVSFLNPLHLIFHQESTEHQGIGDSTFPFWAFLGIWCMISKYELACGCCLNLPCQTVREAWWHTCRIRQEGHNFYCAAHQFSIAQEGIQTIFEIQEGKSWRKTRLTEGNIRTLPFPYDTLYCATELWQVSFNRIWCRVQHLSKARTPLYSAFGFYLDLDPSFSRMHEMEADDLLIEVRHMEVWLHLDGSATPDFAGLAWLWRWLSMSIKLVWNLPARRNIVASTYTMSHVHYYIPSTGATSSHEKSRHLFHLFLETSWSK